MTFEMDDDLSELMDDEAPEVIDSVEIGVPEDFTGDMPDRIYADSDGTPYWYEAHPGDAGIVEYIRADAIREGFTKAIWREAARYANSTAGQPGGALRRVRDLIEGGR